MKTALFSQDGRPLFFFVGHPFLRMYQFKGAPRESNVNHFFEMIYPRGQKEQILYREMLALINEQFEEHPEESIPEKSLDVTINMDIPDPAAPMFLERFEKDPDWDLISGSTDEPSEKTADEPQE